MVDLNRVDFKYTYSFIKSTHLGSAFNAYFPLLTAGFEFP